MIRKLFHLSDIHIRLFTRHEEYNEIFEKLYKEIQKHEKDQESLIVLTGDIVHSKNDLSPELELVTFDFFQRLAELCPTFIIAGNHDALLNNRDRVDAISSILYQRNMKNLFYLKDTGIYEYQNIKFYVDSLLDDDTIDMTNKNEFSADYIHVGLYHGAIKGWKNLRGFVSPTGENHLENFSGLDYLLLGDIHLFQYMSKTEKPIAAYASSLISQNFHEVDENHGFLIWDLERKTQKYVPIPNDYRYQLVTITEDHRLQTDEKPPVTVEEMQSIACKGHIKLLGNHDEIQSRSTLEYLKRKFPQAQFCYESNVRKQVQEFAQSQGSGDTIAKNMEDDLRKSEEGMVSEYVMSKLDALKIKDKEEILTYVLRIFQENQPISNNVQYCLKEIEFSNMFGYGANNKINLESYDKNIIGIFGENAFGKSSLIDIITMLLYDKLTRYSHGASIPKEVIHFDEKKAYGKITLSIGNDIYMIEKNYSRNTNGKISLKSKLFIIQGGRDTTKKQELTGEQRSRTNKLIQEILGGYDNFVFFNTFLQQRENSFREMSSLKRKQFLHSIYGYSFFEQYEKKHKETLKQLEMEYNVYQKKQLEKTNLEYEKEKENVNLDFKKLKQQITIKKKELEECEKNINRMNRELSCGLDSLVSTKNELERKKHNLCSHESKVQEYEVELIPWKEIDFFDEQNRVFETDPLYLKFCDKEKEFQNIIDNKPTSSSISLQEIESELKRCYSKLSLEIGEEGVLNEKILNLFPISDKSKIEKEFHILAESLDTVQQQVKKKYNQLHHDLEDVKDSSQFQLMKEHWTKERKSLLKKNKQVEDTLYLYKNYQDFIQKVDLDYCQKSFQLYQDNPLFQEFACYYLVPQNKHISSHEKWKAFRKENTVDPNRYESEKMKLDATEDQLTLKNEELLRLHFDPNQKTITLQKYQDYQKYVASNRFPFDDSSTQALFEKMKDWQELKDNESKLKEKSELYEEGIEKYKGVQINKNCNYCVLNDTYVKFGEFTKSYKKVQTKLESNHRKQKEVVDKIQGMVRPFSTDLLVQQLDQDNDMDSFFQNLQCRKDKVARYQPLVEHYEKSLQYKKIKKEIHSLQKEKENSQQTLKKIYFITSNQDLFKFIDYQWEKFHFDYEEILPFLDAKKNKSGDYEKLVAEKNTIMEKLVRQQEDVERQKERWFQDISTVRQIEEMEEKIRLYHRYKEWFVELKKFERDAMNQKYEEKISILEKEKYYQELYTNHYSVISFLEKCLMARKKSAFKNQDMLRIYDKQKKLQEELSMVRQEISNLNHDVQVFEKINHYAEEKSNLKTILDNMEYKMTTLRCNLEEIALKQAIWNETNQKLYSLTEKIQQEKIYTGLFEKDGLPAFLLRNKISLVEKKLNEMIHPFIDKKVRFDTLEDKNTIEFGFITKTNQLCSFVSGMESFILDICLKFCLSFFYIRPKLNCFIIDEKISVLDKQKLANIENIFTFLKNTSTNVLLISHIEQVKDYVDKQIIITKTKNKSMVQFN